MSNHDIKNIILNDMEISYKSLSIGQLKFLGKQYIQVHCDKYDLIFSHMYQPQDINSAISKFLELRVKYGISEKRNYSFVHRNDKT